MILRISLAAIGCLLLVRPVLADTRDDVLSGIQRCSAIQDDRTWLNCTYGAQQPMRARLGLPPAPLFQQRLVPPPSYNAAPYNAAPPLPPPPMASYGAPGVQPAPRPAPHHDASFMQILSGTAKPMVVSTLARITFDSQKLFTATLQNGQVWRQVNAGARMARIKPGARITITPGALWSYNLQADGGPSYKVEQRK
jgi:hypothetical protein